MSQFYETHMSGKTVVNIEVKREVYENLPAISVCLPQTIFLKDLAKHRPEYQKDYEISRIFMRRKFLSNSTLLNKGV